MSIIFAGSSFVSRMEDAKCQTSESVEGPSLTNIGSVLIKRSQYY